jgi:peptidyl-tRNA hydrolase, PTH1 family
MGKLSDFFKTKNTASSANLKSENYIVGLGNPGKQYAHTRHNAGFDVIAILAARHGIEVKTLKFKALCGSGMVAGKKVTLITPGTFMNESGISVKELIDFYKVSPEKLIVICDDIDLELSRVRVRKKGSAGTHNGMRSILYHIQTEDFPRVRVGIGKPRRQGALVGHVLTTYTEDEYRAAYEAYNRAADAVETILKEGVEAAQAAFNGASKES